MEFCAILVPSTALSAMFPVAIVFAASSLEVMLFSAIIADSTALACIVAAPVTFPLPSKDADVHTTSPVIPTVLPVSKAVAVAALPVVS